MLGRICGLPVQFEAPFQVRIVGVRASGPSRPNNEQYEQKRKVWIRRFQVEFLNDLFETRIRTLPKPLSALRAEQAVFRNVRTTIPTKHPNPSADKTPALCLRANPARV